MANTAKESMVKRKEEKVEGFEIINLTNEYQIYDTMSGQLVRKVWKGAGQFAAYRLVEALSELTS